MNKTSRKPLYTLRPVITPVAQSAAGVSPDKRLQRDTLEPSAKTDTTSAPAVCDPFLRAATEDDDGYDPFSDRPPTPDPFYQEDPWK